MRNSIRLFVLVIALGFILNGCGLGPSTTGTPQVPPTSAPVIFDLSAGTVAGSACAGCRVEIFSDGGDQGATFEGQTMANVDGAFTFEKGAAFAGPHLTATTHDLEGNTSRFSASTSGSQRHIVLQAGNQHPKAHLETRRSNELEDNRIGSVGMSDMADSCGQPHDLTTILEQVVSMGLQQFRFTIVNIDGSLVDWDKPEFTFEPRQKDFVTAMDENGVKIAYLLIFRDDELGGEGRSLHPRFKTEAEIQRYLDYVRFVIGNVKGHVRYYEIWNEPNIGDSVQWIEAADYINLVRRVVPVITWPGPFFFLKLPWQPTRRNSVFSVVFSPAL